MGHRQRMEAMVKAGDRGREARDAGKSRSENPYKPGPWSNYLTWDIAWERRDAELVNSLGPRISQGVHDPSGVRNG